MGQTMKQIKAKRLTAAGWRVGGTQEFLGLSDEEAAFVQAQVGHAIAIIRLRKEVGTLLRSRESRPTLDEQQSRWLTDRVRSREQQTAEPSRSASDVQQVSATRPDSMRMRR